MKNSELFDELFHELRSALDNTLSILLEKGIDAGLPCIRELTPSEAEQANPAPLTIKDLVESISFLKAELKLKDEDKWLKPATDRLFELLLDLAAKSSRAIAQYYLEMETRVRALQTGNPEQVESNIVLEHSFEELEKEAIEACSKVNTVLRFMISRVYEMNDKLVA